MGSKLLKGFRDIYPLADSLIEDSILWSYINKIIRKRLETYNFEEIITPSIENIDTFKKGMGDNTDIVSKEMYEFMLYKDGEIKEDIIYALRPEGTASVVRAYLENSLNKKRKINKLYYIGPMFRYERSQKGRYRQFYQVGAEILGSDEVFYELELVMLAINLLKEFRIKDFDLEINVTPQVINKFISGKSALAEEEYFTVITDGNNTKLVIGYASVNTNRVTIPVTTNKSSDIKNISFCTFSYKIYFKLRNSIFFKIILSIS